MRDMRQTMYEEAVELLVANGFRETIAREKLNRALPQEIAVHARPIELALSADGGEVGVVVNRHFRACPDPGCRGVRMQIHWSDGDTSYPCSTNLKFPMPFLCKVS